MNLISLYNTHVCEPTMNTSFMDACFPPEEQQQSPFIIDTENNTQQTMANYHHIQQQYLSVSNKTTKENSNNEFALTEYDILVGRHKLAFNHVGNRRFRAVISSFLPKYFESTSRTARARLVQDIINSIELAGGRFVKQADPKVDNGELIEITLKEKRNKVGHAIRDAAKSSGSSSSCSSSITKVSKTSNKGLKKQNISSKKLSMQTLSLPTVIPSSIIFPAELLQDKNINKIKNNSTDNNDDELLSLLSDDSIDLDIPVDLDLLLSIA